MVIGELLDTKLQVCVSQKLGGTEFLRKLIMSGNQRALVLKRLSPVLGWGAKSGLGNPGVQALGAHSEQLE